MKMKTNINEFYDDIILSDFYEETRNMFNDYCFKYNLHIIYVILIIVISKMQIILKNYVLKA